MDNYKNTREDKDLFPYEYGAEYLKDDMANSILTLFRREELKSHFDQIWEHIDEFSIPGNNSFKRKVLHYLSDYMNYKIRYRGTYLKDRGLYLKKDDKFRELLYPLAKIICSEKLLNSNK